MRVEEDMEIETVAGILPLKSVNNTVWMGYHFIHCHYMSCWILVSIFTPCAIDRDWGVKASNHVYGMTEWEVSSSWLWGGIYIRHVQSMAYEPNAAHWSCLFWATNL
jgi:hypothetical protein